MQQMGRSYAEFWEAPERFWAPKIRWLEEVEIEAISVRRNGTMQTF